HWLPGQIIVSFQITRIDFEKPNTFFAETFVFRVLTEIAANKIFPPIAIEIAGRGGAPEAAVLVPDRCREFLLFRVRGRMGEWHETAFAIIPEAIRADAQILPPVAVQVGPCEQRRACIQFLL